MTRIHVFFAGPTKKSSTAYGDKKQIVKRNPSTSGAGGSSSLHGDHRPQAGETIGEGFGHLELCLFRAMDIGVGGEVII